MRRVQCKRRSLRYSAFPYRRARWRLRVKHDDGSASRSTRFEQLILRRLEVPLPPLAEQRRIAEVLDRAEALRAKRRAALAQLDTLTQSIFLDLFGDPATNPKGWPASGFGDVCDYANGARSASRTRQYARLSATYLRMRNGHVDASIDVRLRLRRRDNPTQCAGRWFDWKTTCVIAMAANSALALVRLNAMRCNSPRTCTARASTETCEPIVSLLRTLVYSLEYSSALESSASSPATRRTSPLIETCVHCRPTSPPRPPARLRPPCRRRRETESRPPRLAGRARRALRLPPAPRLPRGALR